MTHVHSVSRPLFRKKSVGGRPRLAPMVEAITFAVMGLASTAVFAQSAAPIGSGWIANSQNVSSARAARAGVPAGADAGIEAAKLRQQQASRQALRRSVANLERTAAAIAAQQAAQQAARDAASIASTNVPDGLVQGGLWDRDASGNPLQWTGADRAVQTVADGKTTVAIKQTESKAVLNWDTFNVGRNTTVDFQQNSTDAVLNRVVGQAAAPSQILGAIQGDGTVMVVNQNGVVFSGTGQVNVRNLVAAAAVITDDQFLNNGLYVNTNGTSPTFINALGDVVVEAGAQIDTAKAKTSTVDGGYVMLLGANVSNAGQITTPGGQAVLAAGDSFYIRKGVGTDANPYSTISGNEVSTARAADSNSGRVENTGLITATTGDITLTGHEVVQAGVAAATTSTSKRGTIHLSNRASDSTGTVTLTEGATTAVFVDDSDTTALDSQRGAALEDLGIAVTGDRTGVFDNLSGITDRTDLSRIEIVSGNTVEFQGDSMTLATGGEITVTAANRALVDDGATLDVSGAVGVRVAMESNNIAVNVQGNEQRDSSGNRDSENLNSSDVWVDRRRLVYVPAGTNGYESDRWYTEGGLLEVSGYLATSGHTMGEWMAQGGTVTVTGGDLVTRSGSSINLSGGTLDVQSGYIHQTWLKGGDGRLYELSNAPGNLIYKGLYQGYELSSERWGQTNTYYSPLIGSSRRYEPGYTVGRDAGKLVVATGSAVLEGGIVSDVYQGDYQTDAAQVGLDGYYQSQSAVARAGQLIVGSYSPIYDADNGLLRYALSPVLNSVTLEDREDSIADGLQLGDAVAEDRQGALVLDTGLLNLAELSAIRVAANESIGVGGAVGVAAGGEIVLYAPAVDVAADLTAHSGTIRLGNVLGQSYVSVSTDGTTYGIEDTSIAVPGTIEDGGVWVREAVTLDATGLVTDLRDADAGSGNMLAYVDGGTVSIRSTESVTLAGGSLIDVSSGAVVLADENVIGGTGGNVQLGSGLVSTGTGNAAAVLTLDGDVRGYGVNGGGTLEIESASAIAIGGDLLQTNGELQVGETVLADLILLEDYEVKAGEILPIEYSYLDDTVLPGNALGSAPNGSTYYTLASDWEVPTGSRRYDIRVYDSEGGNEIASYAIFSETELTLPAGTVITINGSTSSRVFPVDYVVEQDVFPNGMILAQPREVILSAGQTSPSDYVIGAGARLPAGVSLSRPVRVAGTTQLATSLFNGGFSNYDVRAHNGLTVANGISLDVVMPVLRVDPATGAGSDRSDDLIQVWLPGLYREDYKNRKISQRSGASLSLAGGVAASATGSDRLPTVVGDSGNLYAGTGVSMLVDPGQSISLSSRGNLTVDGLLQAKGGSISLLGPMTAGETGSLEGGGNQADGTAGERAITLGANAVLDASASVYVAYDPLGRPYGTLTDGGSVVIGGVVQESDSRALASDAFVVIKEGALVDVSGGAALLDVNNTGVSIPIASDGGGISIASASGLYLEGTLRAETGGAGASGGSLALALEAPNYKTSSAERAVLGVRELTLVQNVAQVRDDETESDEMAYGHAVLGMDQVEDGGFSSLMLYSNGAISFGGDVGVVLDRDLRIYSGALTVADGIEPSINVSLSAPYLLLAGITDNASSADTYTRPSYQGGISTLDSQATLTFTADLIDVKGVVTVGLDDTLSSATVTRAGFEQLNLVSRGDIRFVDAEALMSGGNPLYATELNSSGDILLRAAQIYPATGIGARVLAGRADESAYDPEGRLVVERYETAATDPAVPYSVFGRLTLGAATIEQNGVVRAPLGTITVGTDSSGTLGDTGVVALGAGSLTSVSAAGLTIPYGGTADNVTWYYDGREVNLSGVGDGPAITLSGNHVAVEQGAALDMSGGGELTGAGFVSGRGGSTDARYNALVQVSSSGFSLPGLDTNPVYAIVPGYASSYAPADGTGAVDPLAGLQVTIQAGDIPGLAAGTYTLLPSSYSLLPGAFRVEINGTAISRNSSHAVAMRNGSWVASGALSIANTSIASSLAGQFIITPADVLRTYSEYNESSYAEYVQAQARLSGTVRAVLPTDAGTLAIRLPSSSESTFSFEGLANFTPGEGGYGGVASIGVSGYVVGNADAIEVLGSGNSATHGFEGVSVYADDLNSIGASRLEIGGYLSSSYGETSDGAILSNYLNINGQAGSIILRDGAVLRAPEVFLIADSLDGGISIEAGAGIHSIGTGKVAYDSLDGYVYRPWHSAVVAVSNGWINMLAPERPDGNWGAGPITIGACGVTCSSTAELYSEGTLLAATLSDFDLDGSVRYGSRNLVLSVGTVNAGSNEDLTAAAAHGALTGGLVFNQSVLDRLLRGDTAYGAPALERLVLTAGESFNFFGDVSLDTTDVMTGAPRLDNLVLSTPAIYGYGEADSIAAITVGTLIWAGLDADAPTPVIGGRGTGSGSLVVNADVIEFGYDDSAQPSGIDDYARTILGFANVAFNASDRITANQRGSLAVYQSQAVGEDGVLQYSGGNLTLATPLVTGEGGSVNRVTAGGTLQILAPEPGAADGEAVALNEGVKTGAELDLTASSIVIDTTVALPSGKLTAAASGDITLADGAYLDLSGRAIAMYDATSYSWGGDVILQSDAGNITQAAGSTIDVSAENNNAGLIAATALAEGAGVVSLQGTLLGSAHGHYDAGGTDVPYRAGGVNIGAQSLGNSGTLTEQFAALNTQLNEGGLTGERSFQLKQGDLAIGDELHASEINVSLDNGALIVNGTIDASGEQVGSIRLAAANGLVLAGTAVLDAHGTLLRVDSYGEIIDGPNRAAVELDAGTGTLALADGARIDLRYGTDDPRYIGDPSLRALTQEHGALGTLDLYAARLDADGQAGTDAAATYGDIAIDARGSVAIDGAKSIAVYGRQVYDDAPYGSDEAASGRPYQVITQAYLDGKDAEATFFIAAALNNTGLLGTKLAGLYNSAFHLRPSMEIVSATADGDLVVSGDLDLSGYRYASLNPNSQKTSIYGSGEVGHLTLRAGGDLSIYGSINDGFAPPPATPDDEGWLLTSGVQAFGGDVVVPVPGVTLAEGTTYPAGKTLNYAITASDVTLPSGTTLPVAITLSRALTLPADTVLAADVLAADGSVLLAAGAVVGADGLALPTGAQLQAGIRLPVSVTVAALTWPSGTKLPVAMVQAGSLTLPVGALIASGTDIVLPDDAAVVDLRPKDVDGNYIVRSNWAVAKMLPEGSQSWSMQLVAGADAAAADRRLTRMDGGSLILADTHYTALREYGEVPVEEVWVWALGNSWGMPEGEVVTDPDYLAYCQADGACIKTSGAEEERWVWAPGNSWGMPDGEEVTDPDYLAYCQADGACVLLPGSNGGDGGTGPQTLIAATPKSPIFSVLRTGAGNLDIAVSDDFSMHSPYGVYTAGSQSGLGSAELDAAYNRAHGLVAGGTVLGTNAGDLAEQYEAFVSGTDGLYQAWYPDGGGSLWVSVGGDLTGDSWSSSSELTTASSSVGNWLWRQGTGSSDGVDYVPTSWWINFGTYTYDPYSTYADTDWPVVTGFTGIGTLGGGNASIRVGGDASVVTTRSTASVTDSSYTGSATARSQGLVLGVGSSGRVLEDGSLVLTGGGDLDVRIGGGWNRYVDGRLPAGGQIAQTHELYGALVNLRGVTTMSAGQIGTIELIYGLNSTGTQANQDTTEVRASDPYTSSLSLATGGLMMVEGDSVAIISSRGDLVLGGAADAGLVATAGNYTGYGSSSGSGEAGQSWFSLWTDGTALNLNASGGNLAFDTRASEAIANNDTSNWDYKSNGGWFLLPGNVSAVAAEGSIYYGSSAGYLKTSLYDGNGGLLLVPLGEGVIELMAGDSIYGGGYAISSSGSDTSSIATIFNPAFAGFDAPEGCVSNASPYAPVVEIGQNPLFAFGINSIGSELGGRQNLPSRFYAVDGDIVGLHTGTVVAYPTYGVRAGQTDYVGAGPISVRAGRDIVSTGGTSSSSGFTNDYAAATLSGSLIVHTHSNDVSVIEAGRDIYYAQWDIAGPGVLEISAGNNIIQNDLAHLTSIGPVVAGDSRSGASIVVQAGQTVSSTNYAGFLAQYLNSANLADGERPLADQQGKVVETYEIELVEWLAKRYGFEGTPEEALAYFAGLAPEQQRIFARQAYFAELKAGGREYNDADGPRPGSYLRGRNAIASLFPTEAADGGEIAYAGNLLMYGGSGIHTNLGGDIQVLTPGGAQTYGVEGPQPPSTAGLITRGQGNIQLYSLGSILLGQSRIMTTFGGDILAWSAEGDINAGRGSKTTVVYTPPRRVYDNVGDVTISPDVPSTGAGIATLNPIPEVEPGDVDLIAPLGTIDAGEAGIRVSGNVNIAALQVINAANIQVQGEAAGIPVIAAVNASALASASSAASSATQAAQEVMRQQQAAARQNQRSSVSVQILGFGDEML